MVYELITSEYLFRPKESYNIIKGGNISKTEDHLALMMETLGAIPIRFIKMGSNSSQFFNK